MFLRWVTFFITINQKRNLKRKQTLSQTLFFLLFSLSTVHLLKLIQCTFYCCASLICHLNSYYLLLFNSGQLTFFLFNILISKNKVFSKVKSFFRCISCTLNIFFLLRHGQVLFTNLYQMLTPWKQTLKDLRSWLTLMKYCYLNEPRFW